MCMTETYCTEVSHNMDSLDLGVGWGGGGAWGVGGVTG